MVFYTAVHFRCRSKVDFGDKVVVVGSNENLGNWELKNSHKLSMSNTVEDVWNSIYPVYLPLKEYIEYRYAVLNEKDEFLRWNDPEVRHVEPTGNEMIVEDDEGYYRSECSTYPKDMQPQTSNGKNMDLTLSGLKLNQFLNEPEPNADDSVYFVTSRLPVQVFRREDGTFGIRDSNTPLTTMLWELRKRFRNKMKFVGACSITYESEKELNAVGLKTDLNLHSRILDDTQFNERTESLDRLPNRKEVNKNGREVQFNEKEQNQIKQLLMSHDCIPVFIPPADISDSLKFCKKYMWNLFYNIGLWDITEQNEFDWDLWHSYCNVNKLYAQVVSQYLGRGDFTWVQDYKLLMVPQFLSRKCKTANIGLFMHALFPSYTLFACLAVREEILRSMLCADLVGFHYFEFAKHFLTSCKRILGLEYNFSTGGTIAIEYNGRQVMIRMSQVHVQSDLLQKRIGPETRIPTLASELKKKWPNRFIVASVDRDIRLSGLLLKFTAFKKFLQNYPYARGKILLVQYICTIDTLWQGHSDVQRKLSHLSKEINDQYQTVHVILNMNANYEEKYALFVASDCYMDTSVRGGINLCAYEYVYCRKGKPALAIISEFTGVSRTLLSAIRINPWHTDSVMQALDTAMSLEPDCTVEPCKKDVSAIESNDAITWVNDFVKEMYYSRKKQDMLHTSWGFGNTYKTLTFPPNFQLLNFDMVLSRFENSRRKLLFLDCEGTLSFNPFDVESKIFYRTDIDTKSSPLQVNLDNLAKLSKDKNNIIVLISCRTTQVMDSWFSSVPNVGLCAERGYHFKLPYVFGHSWQTLQEISSYTTHLDNRGQTRVEMGNQTDNWKVVALKLFEQYVHRTPGSYLESKDSCLVFQFQNSDKEFGILQANELNTSLSEVMSGFPVDIHRGKGYLEVRLKGINKGNALLNVVNKYQSLYGDFDFILCMGDDRSDEESFKALETLISHQTSNPDSETQKIDKDNYISCIVGKRPTKAKFYLNDYLEVADLLTALANMVDQ